MTYSKLLRLPGFFCVALIGVVFLTAQVRAQAPPRDELLRLVPDDMMFCIALHDLREHAKRIEKDDSFLAAVKRMPFARAQMESPEFKKLLDVQQYVLSELKITPRQLREDLLGDTVVFAYRQGNLNQPQQEQALLLVKARDAKLLATVADRINELQIKTGELKELRTVKYGDRDYIERVKMKDGKPTESEYYFVRDNLLVFAQREEPIKHVIDRESTDVPDANRFWVRRAKNLGIEKPLVSFLLNPRAFDDEIAAREKAAGGSERVFLKEFQKYWKAIDGVGAYTNLGADLEIGIAIEPRKLDLPLSGQRLFAEMGKPSALWSAIPDDCLLALSARIDSTLVVETISGFIEGERKKEVRKWLQDTLQPFLPDNGSLDSLLKGLGPDWGFWVLPPASGDRTWVPQAILAVSIPNTSEGVVAEATSRNAVQFLLTAAQLSKEDFKVESIKIDKTTIKCLSHATLFPPGFRPSFAVKDGYLLLASCPEAIGRFEKPKAAFKSDTTPLLRVSAKAWRNYLSEHKSGISGFFEKTSGAPAREVTGVLEQITANLEPFDRLDIGIRGEKDRGTVILRVTTSKSK
jgi:hypothetical protein